LCFQRVGRDARAEAGERDVSFVIEGEWLTTSDKGSTESKKKTSDKDLVDKAIESIGSKIEANEVKGTLGDFLRLLEYKKQMEEDQPQDIVVTWKDDEPSE
jgi:hypothetical protein